MLCSRHHYATRFSAAKPLLCHFALPLDYYQPLLRHSHMSVYYDIYATPPLILRLCFHATTDAAAIHIARQLQDCYAFFAYHTTHYCFATLFKIFFRHTLRRDIAVISPIMPPRRRPLITRVTPSSYHYDYHYHYYVDITALPRRHHFLTPRRHHRCHTHITIATPSVTPLHGIDTEDVIAPADISAAADTPVRQSHVTARRLGG